MFVAADVGWWNSSATSGARPSSFARCALICGRVLLARVERAVAASMAPSHIVFDNGEAQPKYGTPTQSASIASPAQSTSKRATPQSPRSTTAPPRSKRPKVANFTTSDEEDGADTNAHLSGARFGQDGDLPASVNGPSSSGVRGPTPKGKVKYGMEDKERRTAEALRLLTSRKELPIWGGQSPLRTLPALRS